VPRVTPIRDDGVFTVVLEGPILSRETLAELALVLDRLFATEPVLPVVLASAHPTIFLAGAHLGEIAELDVHSCTAYARLGRSLACRIDDAAAPVVAAVHGSCSGGGLDLVMACDAVVASPGATFSHPGVRRGLVTGWGGTVNVPGALGTAAGRGAFLEGVELDASEMLELGAVRSIAEDPLPEARRVARHLGHLDRSRLRAWRLLRGPNFVDRFRAFVVEKS
jgi:enoyl-CoA hydratase